MLNSQSKIPGALCCMYALCVAACMGLLLHSCTSKTRENDRMVAKVGDKYLYFSEMSSIFPKGCSKDDSLSLAKLYVDNWIKTRLLLKKAELNLSDAQLDITDEIETYRTSLLIYKYEDQLLQEKLDTTVLENEIQGYYDANMVNFLLDDYVVKATYLKIPSKAPNIDNAKRWYLSDKEKDIQDLTSYCQNYASKYDHFGDEWVMWSQIEKELPQKEVAAKQLAQNGRIEQEEGGFVYLVRIKEKRAPGDTAPLVIVKDKVKSIIINKRKLKFISELERNIYNDALVKNQFEVFNIN